MTTAELEQTAARISPRFCGPDGIGHWGYLAGLLVGRFEGSAEVTLCRPAPLDRALSLEWFEHVLLLCDGAETVAAAEPVDLDLRIPTPPSYQEAVHATRLRIPIHAHPFPRCFGCGPARAEGDGLGLQPGPLEGRKVVAAPWIPDRSLADGANLVRDEFVCAALDCPGWVAAVRDRPAGVGRIAVALNRPVLAGERYVVMGWPDEPEGGMRRVGTAVCSADGVVHAAARATWKETR